MSQSTHQSTNHKRQSQDKNQTHAYAKVWLYFMYYWMIFGIGCYFGQYLPMSWRKPLSIGLLILILATLFIKRARKYGLVISHIYAIIVGLLSYALFTTYLQNLGAEVFYKNIILAIGAFIAFGIVGYFLIKDASSMGKYLFVTLIAPKLLIFIAAASTACANAADCIPFFWFVWLNMFNNSGLASNILG